MRLLFVLPEFGDRCPGGIATYYRQLITALQHAGCRTDVICTGTLASQSQCGADTIRTPDARDIDHQKAKLAAFASLPQLHHQLAVAYAAFELAKDTAYDAVEVSDWGSLYAPWCLQETAAPVIVALHGSPGQISFQDPMAGNAASDIFLRLFEMALLPRADMLQSCSRANAGFWADLLQIPVTHIASPFKEMAQPLTRESLSDRGVVLARLQLWKGPEILLQALRGLGAQAPSIDWVGASTLSSDHKTWLTDVLASKYHEQWGHSFHYRGGVSPREANEFTRKANFVVHPSLWDVYPLACLEAMASAKILICSEGAGVSEIIEHARNGFTFPSGDWRALADALQEVRHLDRQSRTKIEAAARETIAIKHDPRQIVEKRLGLIRALKKKPRSSHPWLEGVFAGDNRDDAASILDRIPMKILAPYMLARFKTKVTG